MPETLKHKTDVVYEICILAERVFFEYICIYSVLKNKKFWENVAV